jgi:hypothetical protein
MTRLLAELVVVAGQCRPAPYRLGSLVPDSCPGRAVNSTTQEGAIAVPGEEVSFRSDGCTIGGTFTKAADPVPADYSNGRRGQ